LVTNRDSIYWILKGSFIVYFTQLQLMEINLDELMTLQSALVNVKMFLSQERKIDSDNLDDGRI
jgi:hypothetical protein